MTPTITLSATLLSMSYKPNWMMTLTVTLMYNTQLFRGRARGRRSSLGGQASLPHHCRLGIWHIQNYNCTSYDRSRNTGQNVIRINGLVKVLVYYNKLT